MRAFLLGLDRALSRLYRLSGYAAAVCLVAIAALVCASILSRLLSAYVPGLTEYSGYAMAAASFLALAYTFDKGGHIRVELVLSRLHRRRRWLAEIWCLGAASIVTAYLAFYLCRLVYFSWKFEEHSEGADAILLWKPQAVVMIGAIVLAVAVLHRLVRTLTTPDQEEF
jgi:TRAP-type C4-dicarboxylate transport system permease small subunit